MPVDVRLPELWDAGDWAALVERIAAFPDALRSELLDHCTREQAQAWLSEQEPVYAKFMRGRPDTVRFRRTLDHYDRIRIAAQLLRVFSRPEATHPYDYTESLVSTLRYADLSYLRQCGVCDRIFYAKRKTQRGCTTHHQTILYKRDKRAADKNSLELRKSGKVKVRSRK